MMLRPFAMLRLAHTPPALTVPRAHISISVSSQETPVSSSLHKMNKYTTSSITPNDLGVGGVAMVFEIEANFANNVVAFSGWVVGGRPARCAHADTHAQTNEGPCF